MTETTTTTKLGTAGHYSWQNACQAATVVHANEDGTVNIAGYNHTGDYIRREDVKIGPIEGDDAEFHLGDACPWGR